MKKAEMVIETSLREGGTDPIFRIAGEAANRTRELGPEAVINSTIGALMDDPAKLTAMATAARSAGKPDATRLLGDLTEAIASGKSVAEFKKEVRP